MLTVCSIDFYELCWDHGCESLGGERDLRGVCDSMNMICTHVGSAHATDRTHTNVGMKIQ